MKKWFLEQNLWYCFWQNIMVFFACSCKNSVETEEVKSQCCYGIISAIYLKKWYGDKEIYVTTADKWRNQTILAYYSMQRYLMLAHSYFSSHLQKKERKGCSYCIIGSRLSQSPSQFSYSVEQCNFQEYVDESGIIWI